MSKSEWVLGIIGGSGLYEIEGLDGQWRDVESHFGSPSDQVFDGTLNGVRVVFLPRHGRGHKFGPSAINYQANIDVLKRCGVTDIISVSAVGSLNEAMAPGHFVLPDQYIDRTFERASSFFGWGIVAHVSMADPICGRLTQMLAEVAAQEGATIHPKGTYLAMEGPQFSTRAESHLYRAWGADIIGMTNMPEAKLAREAELPYASLTMVTDYDCWRESEAPVEVAAILAQMHQNAAMAKNILRKLISSLADRPRAPSPIDTGLDMAIVTPIEQVSDGDLHDLDAILARYKANRAAFFDSGTRH